MPERGRYTESVKRIRALLLCAFITGVAAAQEPQYQQPPEEDEDLTRKTEYSFNPLQAEKEFRVGEFYWKKGSWKAAAGRYEEAVKWNPSYAEAYWKLGLARQKLLEEETQPAERQLQLDAAREAFRKYLELAPDGKRASDARKHLARLERR